MELRNRTTKVTRTNLEIDLELVAITLPSATMDMELFRVILPLHTQPTDAASETELPNSVKVQGSLNMGAKSTVSDAEALGVGERRKIPTDKGKQHGYKG